jgi:hypothetical protein
MVGGGDPEGEIEAAGAFGDVAGFVGSAEDFDETAGDGVCLLIDITTNQKGAVDGGWPVEDAHGEGARSAVWEEEVEVRLGGGGAVTGEADALEIEGGIVGGGIGLAGG